jgi:uncharacterized small protein (DUF1192 family)
MENLNAENLINEIQSLIKALKDCGGWVKRGNGEGWFNHEILADALSLINSQEQRIKELTEENERLRAENENKCKDCAGCISDKCDCANIEAYTVEKYKSAIIEYYSKPKYQPTKEHPIKHTQIEYLFAVLDQIAKEMLEGENEN